ncbi:MAG: hypothetical protein ACYC4D_00350 [Thermoleophilia bacterium]
MKRSQRFLLTIVIMAITALFLPGVTSAFATSGPTPEFPVHLVCGDVYWDSYADYTARLLTVEYNVGTVDAPAYNVTIHSATATEGVIAATDTPIWMGDFASDYWQTKIIKWTVPSGVLNYRTTISMCASCDGSICGNGTDGGIDIKVGSCPNPIMNNDGQVAVAVFSVGDPVAGTYEFDARTLDDATVKFANASPAPAGIAEEDINSDGLMDMVYHFNRTDTNLVVGDSRACLSATITGDGEFRACDMVIVKNKNN